VTLAYSARLAALPAFAVPKVRRLTHRRTLVAMHRSLTGRVRSSARSRESPLIRMASLLVRVVISTTVPCGNDRFYYKDGNVSKVTLDGYRPGPAGCRYVPWRDAVRGRHAPGRRGARAVARLAGPVRSSFSAKDVAVLDRPVVEN
jgi:hypothetical protein